MLGEVDRVGAFKCCCFRPMTAFPMDTVKKLLLEIVRGKLRSHTGMIKFHIIEINGLDMFCDITLQAGFHCQDHCYKTGPRPSHSNRAHTLPMDKYTAPICCLAIHHACCSPPANKSSKLGAALAHAQYLLTIRIPELWSVWL